MPSRRLAPLLVLALVVIAIPASLGISYAEAPGNEHFQRTWERTDQPVAANQAIRTWMWGPEAFTGLLEEAYKESPNGLRTVQYFDKARMEITDPGTDPNSIWFVTNGLLVVELISGRNQLGDDTFIQAMPAAINVAGDASDPNGPTYATFASVLDAAPLPIGTPQAPFAISQSIDRQGNVSEALQWANYGIGTAYLDEITNHSIAQPFWSFMNSTGTVYENGAYIQDALFENAFFATGRPITEAYWSSVLVGGAPADVLIQCFERRCLTYTPDNAPEWQVESGNVGQHYYRWLYEQDGEAQGPCPDSSEGAYLYVADQFNDRVQKFNGAGDFICTWGGGDPPTSFRRPIALKVGPDGYIYVLAETGIHKYNYRGGFEAHIALPESGALDFAVTHAGLLVVPSVIDSSIQIHDTLGNLVHEWGSMGTGQGQFDQPWGVAVDADDNIYVVDHNNYRVQIFNPSGDFVTEFGVEGEADHNTEFTFPIGITVDDSGGVYVVDSGYVKMFGLQGGYVPTGIWGGTLGEGYAGDNSIVVTTTGKSLAYVTDTFNEQVHVFSYSFGANGAEELNLIGDFGTAEGQFDNPVGIGVNGR